jgi:hypothetical protein
MITGIEIVRGSMSHPVFALIAALTLAVAVGLLGRRGVRERLAYSTYLLVCCIGSVIAGSWVMHVIHG